MPYLQDTNAEAAASRPAAHRCFQPYTDDAHAYALAVARASDNCRAETNRLGATCKSLPTRVCLRAKN